MVKVVLQVVVAGVGDCRSRRQEEEKEEEEDKRGRREKDT